MDGCVRRMERGDALRAASLHKEGICKGFLSRLGRRFLTQLYKAVPACPDGFGYVYEDKQGKVLGFVACAMNTRRVYRQALRRRGLGMALALIKHFLSPRTIRGMVETLRYPDRHSENLPAAEVLSIALDPGWRRHGVGKRLMAAAMREFATKGIQDVKLTVAADNRPANNFYRTCGFDLATRSSHHGVATNVYVIWTDKAPAMETAEALPAPQDGRLLPHAAGV